MNMLEETKTEYTYEDYRKLPEGAPYQLIDGKLLMSPVPTTYHQRILRRLSRIVGDYVEQHQLGEILFAPVDVYLSATETYQPDIVFIAQERLTIIAMEKIEGAPDLVVEVLSPTNVDYDLRHKTKVYEQFGVREYWIVDPMEKSVELYANENQQFKLAERVMADGVLNSKLLAGLAIRLSAIF